MLMPASMRALSSAGTRLPYSKSVVGVDVGSGVPARAVALGDGWAVLDALTAGDEAVGAGAGVTGIAASLGTAVESWFAGASVQPATSARTTSRAVAHAGIRRDLVSLAVVLRVFMASRGTVRP